MTIKEFTEAFKGIADQYVWKMTKHDCIRGLRKGEKIEYCPLTALYRSCGGRAITCDAYVVAYGTLGLSKEDGIFIMTAADGMSFTVESRCLRGTLMEVCQISRT